MSFIFSLFLELSRYFVRSQRSEAESIWIRGGKAFLEVAQKIQSHPHLEPKLRSQLIEDLSRVGSGIGLSADFSASASRQFIEIVASE